MTLRLTDAETEALRAQADLEHRSMQEVARLAIIDRIAQTNRAAKVNDLVDEVVARDAELLRRLAQ